MTQNLDIKQRMLFVIIYILEFRVLFPSFSDQAKNILLFFNHSCSKLESYNLFFKNNDSIFFPSACNFVHVADVE